jgi:hypothetical protein
MKIYSDSFCGCQSKASTGPRHRAIAPEPEAAVSERSITATKALLAGWVGIVSAAIRSVSSGGTRADCSSSDAYRHSTAYGGTTVDATAIDTTVVNANATNANASSVCEGIS